MNRQRVPNANRNESVQENVVLISKAREEGSGESAHMHSLARAFTNRTQVDKDSDQILNLL